MIVIISQEKALMRYYEHILLSGMGRCISRCAWFCNKQMVCAELECLKSQKSTIQIQHWIRFHNSVLELYTKAQSNAKALSLNREMSKYSEAAGGAPSTLLGMLVSHNWVYRISACHFNFVPANSVHFHVTAWSDWQIPGWPQCFQQQSFPSVLPANFNSAIIFSSFHLDFLCAKSDIPSSILNSFIPVVFKSLLCQ